MDFQRLSKQRLDEILSPKFLKHYPLRPRKDVPAWFALEFVYALHTNYSTIEDLILKLKVYATDNRTTLDTSLGLSPLSTR